MIESKEKSYGKYKREDVVIRSVIAYFDESGDDGAVPYSSETFIFFK